MFSKSSTRLLGAALLFVGGCGPCFDLPEPTIFSQETVVRNLQAPIGMALDEQGRFWVSESGTGEQNGRVSLVTADGGHYPVFTGFNSVIEEGSAAGIGHVLYKNEMLYVLDGNAGKLYLVNVSTYRPGDPPRTAQELPGEDIGAYVRAQQLTTPINTNPYNLTFGPDGSLYITDSGANAIIRRDQYTKALSVFARLPNVTATAEAVPTGIVYDGTRFVVSTLSGFPFAPGTAKLYQISRTGQVSDYKTGFTTLTDVALTPSRKPIALEYGGFSLTPPAVGFVRDNGRVADESGKTLAAKLDLPTDIERAGSRTYYVLSHGAGTITKLTY